MIGSILWKTLQEEWVSDLNMDGTAGHDFENQILQRVHSAISKISGLRALPPRTTLKLRTVSGLYHQIDIIVSEGASKYHLLECKFSKTFDIEELYAFNAKLLDYAIGAFRPKQNLVFQGHYIAGLSEVNEHFYQFAFAWGITPVALNGPPPLEFMLYKTPQDSPLREQIEKLLEITSGTNVKKIVTPAQNPHQIVSEWRACYQRWIREGYDN